MIEIRAAVQSKIGFASHQNAVPLIVDLQIENATDVPVGPAILTLTANPSFIAPRTWQFDRLAPGSLLRVNDRAVSFDAGMLDKLNEALRAELLLSLTADGHELAAIRYEVECLPKFHWGGMVTAGLLAAFCMPNDPAVDRVLKGASEALRKLGKADEINGYQRSPQDVWLLASAIWSAVAKLNLSYALPPAGFEAEGQKIRPPSAILDGRVATCLDTTLLFAACLEQANLHPVIVIIKGHAFCGVWLRETSLPQLIAEEAEVVRKHVALNELVVFETTLAAKSPPASFSQSIAAAARHMDEINDANFIAVLDVRRARTQRIRPLGGDDALGRSVPDVAVIEHPVELPPAIGPLPADTEPAVPNTPKGRLEQWQRKLLDLTTRNRLLHVADNAKAMRPLCQDIVALEEKLSSGQKISIMPLPDLNIGGRDAAMYEQQQLENLQEQVARRELEERHTLLCALPKAKLDALMVDLYRTSRSDLQEGGANTLFLALGFLKWKKAAEESRTYRAPLILVPVGLERKSALSGVTMRHHEEEPRFNLTLLELLRQDFNLDIPGLDGPLPVSVAGSGIDVRAILTMVRRAVKDMSGFEVQETVMLGSFSFAKYLMWKDMVDRTKLLTQSPVVKHLMERGAERFTSGGEFPKPDELDRKVDPAKLFLPLAADSSQISAVVASANGCDFVLDGPPGTGKSQTIANMIAHNLALGRRVLFVAEKMAALNVVHRRLEEKGLGEFCLQLHSNKASKVEVLKQLERAWDTRDALSADAWGREAAQLRLTRDRLNEFVALLHREQPNGMTLHQAIGLAVKNSEMRVPRLSWPAPVEHNEADLARLRDIVRRLEIGAAQVEGLPQAFALLRRMDWSNAWQDEIAEIAGEFPSRLEALLSARDRLLAAVKLAVPANDLAEIEALCGLAEIVLATYGQDLRCAFASDFAALAPAMEEFSRLLKDYREEEAKLSVPFGEIAGIPLALVEAEWLAASKKFFLFAGGAKKKVAAHLASLGKTTGSPSPAGDLPRLRRLQALAADIAALPSVLHSLSGWAGLKSDLARMVAMLEKAEALRRAIAAGAADQDARAELRQRVFAIVVEGNDFLAPGGLIARVLAECVTALAQMNRVAQGFICLAGAAPDCGLNGLGLLAAAIMAHTTRLNAWCSWQRVVAQALQTGLSPLVLALPERGDVTLSDLFETAYARWFAARLIDAEPRLREFVPDVHASDIESFRKLEDRIAGMAVRYTRARLCGQIPGKNDVGKKDGYGVLKHQLQLQKRHKPIRQLTTEMGEAFTRLAPCMLMSPLSIAQYLAPEQALFDLVIFDEASQIAPWDAIGAMARGRQVVVAGDPRQMPPTNFFGRSSTDDDVAEDDRDAESILEECLAAGVPQHTLDWHYRSQHESLIAFSNSRYYDNRLITFPAPVTRASAVSWRRVAGLYAKGNGRTNQVEAEALVAEAVARLTSPELGEKTLGIIVLNAEQQHLVEDLLDRARQANPALEHFFGDAVLEQMFVKNLETVQGDERDIILIGIGYGPTEPGAPVMSMNFGPLNRDGGWRRLNVALTRARAEMVLFTSFDSSMIDLSRTSARAVRDLKHFIEFAERGPRALVEAVQGSLGGFDSPFESAVAEALTRKGWQVVTQIGVSRFRIDLGVVHPDRPGDYLVGVECDGAAYHSAATARDRDKVRQAILETLGWKLLRAWSTDWWVDKAGATEKLHLAISRLLEADRAIHAARDQVASETEMPGNEAGGLTMEDAN
jgi:very-short-patch-repair endonuclease